MVRPEATQLPAPFENAPQPAREDLEFHEVMRELDVRPAPWRRESPTRRRHVERVRFLAEDQEQALFEERMEALGVAPLSDAPSPQAEGKVTAPTRDFPEPEALGADSLEAHPFGSAQNAEGQPPENPGQTPHQKRMKDHQASPLERPPASSKEPMESGNKESRRERTRFETAEDEASETMAAEIMASLLEESGFDPGLKFAGAEKGQPRQRKKKGRDSSQEQAPDGELDLHGKTQEEAIRMVQNFLLVSHRQRLRHVLIITGKGNNSGASGPVLGQAVVHWLERNGERFVRNFIPAPPRLGGDGALWITLR